LRSIYFAPTVILNKARKTENESNNHSNNSNNRNRLNNEIKAAEIRVIDEDGSQLGVLKLSEALRIAEEREIDLIEIAPQATPPVCRLMDYGKFQYEIQKREKHQRKQLSQQQMKEIRFKWRTATHDFNFKTRHAKEFIKEGNKVKGVVMFRGREIAHQDVGIELLKRFVAEMSEVAKVDQDIKPEGKSLSVVLAPDKTKKKKEKETPKA
jgi:translation initiation factor IF-3